jgi:hypothetical protein
MLELTAQPFANDSAAGLIVTLTGGNDANMIVNITPYMTDVFDETDVIENPKVGQPVTLVADNDEAVNGQLTLTAFFTDGTQAVILQNNVNIPAQPTTP